VFQNPAQIRSHMIRKWLAAKHVGQAFQPAIQWPEMRPFTRADLSHIHNNPVKAGLVNNPQDYPFSSMVTIHSKGRLESRAERGTAPRLESHSVCVISRSTLQ
jgi:hypothetical protein